MEFDVVVIGSGPGGYVTAIRAAQLGLKTACIEKDRALGGTCLNVGCIPSKCLLHSSHFYADCRHKSAAHGVMVEPTLDFPKMMQRKNQVIGQFNKGIQGLFRKNKVTSIQGTAQFTSPTTVAVKDQTVTGRHFILATGSVPTPLPFLPFDEQKVLSSTGALALEKVPKKMVVVGAGVIGVELGSVYSRLGTEVTFVEFLETVCPTLDGDLSKGLQKVLSSQGLRFQFQTKVTAADVSRDGVTLTIEPKGKPKEQVSADVALVSIGRRPYTEKLGLETIGVELDARGFIPVDGNFRTAQPHIYAIGDLIGGAMLAHKASEEGVAVAELIAGQKAHVSYATIPNVVYTHPEAAAVGLTEAEAKRYNLTYSTATFPLQANSRAQCVAEPVGFVKLIAEKKTGILIGGHILASCAGELIGEVALAIEKKVTAKELAALSHAHPTLSEAVKEAALGLFDQPLHF
ncbi:MAG: dihydrolipoyl dehydrogenase [Chlamydiota bacterium]